MFNEDLFPSSSLMDLLQTAPGEGMSSYIIHEDDNLELPQMIPNLLSEPMSPTDASVNVLDMVSQDMLLENSFHSGADTEVTYASQYAASSSSYSLSAAPFTSAGDVFLPSPITTACNTFVKPLHMFVEHSSSTQSVSPESLLKPMPMPKLGSRATATKSNSRSKSKSKRRPKSRSDKAKSAKQTDKSKTKKDKNEKRKDVVKPSARSQSSKSAKSKTTQASKIVLDPYEKLFEKNTLDSSHARNQYSKPRNSSGKTPAKSNKAHSLLSIINSLSRSLSGKHGAKGQSESIADYPQQQSSLVSSANYGGKLRSTAVTHTVTRPTYVVSKSPIALGTETASVTAATVALTVSHLDGSVTSSLKTSTVTSYSATSGKSPMTAGLKWARAAVTISDSLTTNTLTSYTVGKSRRPISIISPMQSAYTLPTNVLYPTQTKIRRKHSAGGISPVGRPAASSPRGRLLPAQAAIMIPAVSPTGVEGGNRSGRARYVIPVSLDQYAIPSGTSVVSTTATVTRPCIAYPMRPTLNTSVTTVHTRATTTTTVTTAPAARTLTQSTFTLPPGATLYAARKIPSRSVRSGNTPVTSESQTYAFIDNKGAYTTLTIPSEFASTTGSSVAARHTTNTVTAGVSSYTSSVPLDARPRNQYIIPIANSQMNTSTSLGYLVTSPIGSDIIGARGATNTGAGTVRSLTTATATLGSHSITTISTEALNRIRNRILLPGSTGLSSLQRNDDQSMDRPRTPVTIISNQLLSGSMSSDVPMAEILGTSQIPTGSRTLFSPTATQGLYAITTPVSSPSPTGIEPTNRRVVVHVTSNSQSSDGSTLTGSTITTRALPAIPTPGTYIIATGMASSPTGTTSSKSPRIVLPTVHNATIAMPSTRAPKTMTRPFPTSQKCATNAHPKIRNQLIQVSTTATCMPGSTTPITAYTITRTRPPHTVYTIPGAPGACSPTAKHIDTAKSQPTMTLITFATSSAATSTTGSAQSPLMVTSTRCDPSPTTAVMSTSTPTLDSARNRYVIKLNMNSNTSTVAQSSVTTSVATPITTAALSPPEHQFLEPRQVSTRLRTFPGPRTYSVAERTSIKTPPRPTIRNVCPRVKRCPTTPGPLQIFADVVCPPTTVQSNFASTAGQSRPRFALGHTSVISVPHSGLDRAGPRLYSPRTVTERLAMSRLSPRSVRPAYYEPRPAPPRPPTPRPAPPPPAASSLSPAHAPASPEPFDWAVPNPVPRDNKRH